LPTGQWLLLGGEAKGRPVSVALLLDRATKQRSPLGPLAHARSGHTATVLPDGTVLVLGGWNGEGRVETRAEVFDPMTQRFTERPGLEKLARADHSATLLTDGLLLVAGGAVAEHEARSDAMFWDSFSQEAGVVQGAALERPRRQHSAVLLPKGGVLIHGGRDADGNPVAEAEIFDPGTRRFLRFDEVQRSRLSADSVDAREPKVEEGVIAGQLERLEYVPAIRFSKPLDPSSLTEKTVTLIGPAGAGAVRPVVAGRGMLLFARPVKRLLPGTDYDIVIQAADEQGNQLPVTAVHVRTPAVLATDRVVPRNDLPHPSPLYSAAAAGAAAASQSGSPPRWMSDLEWTGAHASGDDELWMPTGKHFNGKWWNTLPPIPPGVAPAAPAGVTALSGRVLRMNGRPLANVTLRANGREAKTDTAGFFLLLDLKPGFSPMEIDGGTANGKDAFYGNYTVRVETKVGVTNQLPYIIWMPKLDPQGTVRVSSPTTGETVVSSPSIPGLELHIPAGTVIRDREGHVVTEINLTAIPVNQPPFPLPDLSVPVYFTIQPGGAVLQALTPSTGGARLFYPNYQREVPGARGVFWNYDPYERGWFIYGLGTVSPDGRQAVPEPGVVITEFTGAMFNTGGPPPPDGGPPQGCGGGGGGGDGKGNPGVGGPSSSECGDPVNVFTGQFTQAETDLFLPDVVPISLTRTYRSLDLNRRMFGVGMTLDYDVFLWSMTGRGMPGGGPATEYLEVDLILPSGKRVHYTRTTSGTNYTDAKFITQAAGRWFGSRVEWNTVKVGWDLFFKDGARWYFPDNAPITEMSDRFGNRLLFTRSSRNGPITRIDSPNGRWVEFTMNASGMVGSAKDNAGRVVTYDYDPSGRLIKVTNPNLEARGFEWTADNRMFRARSAKGDILVENAYVANTGMVAQQTLGDLTTFKFNLLFPTATSNGLTEITDRRGLLRRVVFDASRRILSSTYPVGTPEEQATTFVYDATSGLLTSRTDALGRQTTYAYDALGNATSVTSLAGTADAVSTSYTYSPDFNQVASVTDPLLQKTSYTYDVNGNLLSVTDPLNHTKTMAYDAQGRLTKVTNALNQSMTFTYEGPDMVSVTDALGRSTSMFYNAAGLLLATADPLGNRTRYNYDPAGRPIEVIDPAGNSVKFAYDLNGNRISSTGQRGNVTQYAYDVLNRLSSRTDPLLNAESFTYAQNGLLERVTDREGKISLRAYDSMNRLSRISFGATAATPTVFESTIDYTYDKGDRLLRALDSVGGAIDSTYDGLDRLTKETTPLGTVSYSYDKAGRRIQMLPSGQQSVDYAYDAASRLTEVRNAVSATAAPDVVRITYDNADRYSRVQLRNGVNVDYAYDAAGQLSSITYSTAVATIGGLAYDYDAAGRVIRTGGSLAQVNLPAAVAGNTYNANNQLTRPGYTYDKNGRLTSNGSQRYAWDARDQLSQITGVTAAQFSYDALGRRTRKSINTVPTQFLYDGANIIQELGDGLAPTVNATILTGFGMDEAFGRTKGTVKTEYLSDRLGSTIALSDASASTATTYSYEPYGTATQAGLPDDNARAFTGREDDGTRLLYYRARYYDPANGRFVSEDPIGLESGDVNLYRYVSDNPLNSRDPSGLKTSQCVDCQNACGFALTGCIASGNVICRLTGPASRYCYLSGAGACSAAFAVCVYKCQRDEKQRCENREGQPPPPLGCNQ
jgi:RHS repeat-associated protein